MDMVRCTCGCDYELYYGGGLTMMHEEVKCWNTYCMCREEEAVRREDITAGQTARGRIRSEGP